jgi:hypothetical protein
VRRDLRWKEKETYSDAAFARKENDGWIQLAAMAIDEFGTHTKRPSRLKKRNCSASEARHQSSQD